MSAVDKACDLLKQFEGCKLTAYQDIVGRWTIGWGCTGGIYSGEKWTQDQADLKLDLNVQVLVDIIQKLVPHVNENQLAALTCFAYNVGLQALKTSTLLTKVKLADYSGAAEQFLKWDHAGGVEVQGLLRRRQAERELFLKEVI